MHLRDVDQKLTCFLHDRVGKRPWLDKLAIFAARDLPFVFVALPLIVLVQFSPASFLIAYVLVIALSQFFAYVFQQTLHRSRPFQREHLRPIYKARIASASFPSGHATLVAVVITSAAMLGFSHELWLLLSLVVMSLLILLARVYGGLHYVSDVLAGLVFGYLMTSGFLFIIL